ncbi:hypothetical protein pb186bvf_013301 [Paramecium bursaria]
MITPSLSRKSSFLIHDESQYQLVESIIVAQGFIQHFQQILGEEIRILEIDRQIPDYSIQSSLNLGHKIFLEFIYDDEAQIINEDFEPSHPQADRWRRDVAELQNQMKSKRSSVRTLPLELEIPQELPPIWEPFEPQIVQMEEKEEEINIYEEQMRNKFAYRDQLKAQFEEQRALQEQQNQEERRKIRNLVDGSPDRVTYDYDGKVMIKKKQSKLPQLTNRISGHEKLKTPQMVGEVKQIQYTKQVYKPKKFRLKPISSEDPETMALIRQQEVNHVQNFLEQIELKPGVFIQIGQNEKGQREFVTQAQVLPFQVQNQIEKYLGKEESQTIRLSKQEYSSISMNGSLIKQGSYEQNYLKKKTSVITSGQNNSQSMVDDIQSIHGSVKVNDIGKFYDLLIKDNDEDENAKSQLVLNNSQQTEVELMQIIDVQQKESQVNNPASIPVTQFYRYLDNQRSNVSLSKLEHSSISGSITSKLTRDRSMPAVISNLRAHKFLAAPKPGKFLGFGVNAKYQF